MFDIKITTDQILLNLLILVMNNHFVQPTTSCYWVMLKESAYRHYHNQFPGKSCSMTISFWNLVQTVFISHKDANAYDEKMPMNSDGVMVGGFSKILLALDGSESSRDAAHYAIELAKSNSAELIVITVLHKSLSSYGLAPAPSESQLDREKRALKTKEWFEKVTHEAEATHVTFRTELVDTQLSIESAIVEYAEEENADLIVMGTRGLSGFKRLLLGSVALGVATYSTCPVLIIK